MEIYIGLGLIVILLILLPVVIIFFKQQQKLREQHKIAIQMETFSKVTIDKISGGSFIAFEKESGKLSIVSGLEKEEIHLSKVTDCKIKKSKQPFVPARWAYIGLRIYFRGGNQDIIFYSENDFIDLVPEVQLLSAGKWKDIILYQRI